MRQFLTIVLLLCCMVMATTLNAQVQATVAAGADGEHLCVSIGQPFFTQNSLGDYELSMGVEQAQKVRDTVYDVITYNTTYTENHFNLPAQTGTHKDSVYIVNGGIYNYDLIRTLYLIVCPEKLTDAYSADIEYDVLAVSGHCWTRQNLRSPMEGAMVYTSATHPAMPEIYGLLYTWQTALTANVDGSLTADADGYVQGICPTTKWHIPDKAEMDDLFTNPLESLYSTDGWITLLNNTNSTGFTAYPAGFYNATLSRFEGLGTETNWWSIAHKVTGGVETLYPIASQCQYYCDSPFFILRQNDAISVRCVMKNEWPE